MKFTSELIFVVGKTLKRKDGKLYRIALLAGKNGDSWGGEWEEVFVSDELYKKIKSADFGDKVKCDFNVVNGKIFLEDVELRK